VLFRSPADPAARHQEFVDFFGQLLFWVRSWSLRNSRALVQDEQSRAKIPTVRRRSYEAAGQLAPEEREAALSLAQATLDGFLERLVWILGDEGTDARFGKQLAYRFRVEMEIVDVATNELVEEEVINRGGDFFGKYWGRWLNRFGLPSASASVDAP